MNPIALLSPYMLWIKIAGVVLLCAGSAVVSGYVVHNADVVKLQAVQLANSKAQTANIAASLTQLQGFIDNMNTADTAYNSNLDTIRAQFASIKKDLANVTLKALPADCRPDAGRLRVLTDAVSAANARPVPGK